MPRGFYRIDNIKCALSLTAITGDDFCFLGFCYCFTTSMQKYSAEYFNSLVDMNNCSFIDQLKKDIFLEVTRYYVSNKYACIAKAIADNEQPELSKTRHA